MKLFRIFTRLHGCFEVGVHALRRFFLHGRNGAGLREGEPLTEHYSIQNRKGRLKRSAPPLLGGVFFKLKTRKRHGKNTYVFLVFKKGSEKRKER